MGGGANHQHLKAWVYFDAMNTFNNFIKNWTSGQLQKPPPRALTRSWCGKAEEMSTVLSWRGLC